MKLNAQELVATIMKTVVQKMTKRKPNRRLLSNSSQLRLSNLRTRRVRKVSRRQQQSLKKRKRLKNLRPKRRARKPRLLRKKKKTSGLTMTTSDYSDKHQTKRKLKT